MQLAASIITSLNPSLWSLCPTMTLERGDVIVQGTEVPIHLTAARDLYAGRDEGELIGLGACRRER